MAVDVSPEFSTAIEYNSSGMELYLGESTPGTAQDASGWRIRKFTYNSNNRMTKQEWASGNNMFDKIWDSRATYAYS